MIVVTKKRKLIYFIQIKYINMKPLRITIFFLIAIILFNQKIIAQAGTLDQSFGDTGLIVTELLTDELNKSIIQNDGKILVYGGQYTSVERLNPDGSWDESFGIGGIAYVNNDRLRTYRNYFAIQSDGKIICTAQYVPVSGDFLSCIFRLNTDGSLDSSFGNSGMDTVRIDKLNSPTGIVVQPDGKIVVSGDVGKNIYDEKRTYIYRLMEDGGLDPSFGEGGIVVNNDPNSMHSAALIIRPDGKLIIGSTSNLYGEFYYYQLRSFNPDGSVDAGFGDNGIANFDFDHLAIEMKAMVLQPDGKIDCAGTAGPDWFQMALCRFNEDGTIDAGFGDNGGVITPYLESKHVENYDIKLQPDGKIITTGVDLNTSQWPLLLVRYMPNGSLDQDFGDNGITATYNSPSSITGNNVHVLNDGKILVTGISTTIGGDVFLMLARYNGDNVLAANFKDVKAVANKNTITVTWQTLNESGIKSFTVERSSNANDYVGINTVPAKGVASNYSYTDKNPLDGISYYRIRENAVNGTNTFSPVVKVVFNDNGIISLYPNPAKNTVTVKGLNKNINAVIKITDMQGREISSQNFTQSSSAILNIRALAQGTYFVQVAQQDKIVRLKLIRE